MRLLYISYWGINDVLTKATVLPNLHILKPYCKQIYFTTIERNPVPATNFDNVIHIPFYSFRGLPRFLEKASDYILFSIKLLWIAGTRKTDLVVCRGAMAGAFGVLLKRLAGKPFIVESFEPHADYMKEGNTWKKNGLEYRFQKWIENQSIQHADYLLPVTHNYAEFLLARGVMPDKVVVVPCCVDVEKFKFSEAARSRIRNVLSVDARHQVGIYVGKFGDIYLKEEAFVVFQKAKEIFGESFFLIILTPQDTTEIETRLLAAGIREREFFVAYADHTEVPDYLSAADFAYSLIRSSASRRYCSPIKDGEYWASGLPVLLTKGVGDDEQIIERHKAGAILDVTKMDVETALLRIKSLLANGRVGLAERISPLAKQYRNFGLIESAYYKILDYNRLHKT